MMTLAEMIGMTIMLAEMIRKTIMLAKIIRMKKMMVEMIRMTIMMVRIETSCISSSACRPCRRRRLSEDAL